MSRLVSRCAVLASCRRQAVQRVHDADDKAYFSIYVCDLADHVNRAAAMVVRQGHAWSATPLPGAPIPLVDP